MSRLYYEKINSNPEFVAGEGTGSDYLEKVAKLVPSGGIARASENWSYTFN